MDAGALAGQALMVQDGLRRVIWQGGTLEVPAWRGEARGAFDRAREEASLRCRAALEAVGELKEAALALQSTLEAARAAAAAAALGATGLGAGTGAGPGIPPAAGPGGGPSSGPVFAAPGGPAGGASGAGWPR